MLIRPDVIWKNLSRPLYHVHFTVIHTNSRHNVYGCVVLCSVLVWLNNASWVDSCDLFIHIHDDVIKWKHFPRYWLFVRGIHQSPLNSAHKGQWRGALMFTMICASKNGWVNNREAGDLRRHRFHYGVIIMLHRLLKQSHACPIAGEVIMKAVGKSESTTAYDKIQPSAQNRRNSRAFAM